MMMKLREAEPHYKAGLNDDQFVLVSNSNKLLLKLHGEPLP